MLLFKGEQDRKNITSRTTASENVTSIIPISKCCQIQRYIFVIFWWCVTLHTYHIPRAGTRDQLLMGFLYVQPSVKFHSSELPFCRSLYTTKNKEPRLESITHHRDCTLSSIISDWFLSQQGATSEHHHQIVDPC
jgi:hypothetical protein